MTELTYYEAAVPPWADSAMTVAENGIPVFTLYLKAVNFSSQRYYLGMEFYTKPSRAALRYMLKAFTEYTQGFELEALVDKTDKVAQRFCEFFGFTRYPNYEVQKSFVYERLN